MLCCGGNAVDDENDQRIYFDGPLEQRRCQDIPWLILLILFFIGMLAAVGHAVSKGDIGRIINGMDDFGNVCGRKNVKIEGASKSGEDYSNFKYLKKSNKELHCVEACGVNETIFFHRCISAEMASLGPGATNMLTSSGSYSTTSFFKEAAGDVQYCWREIVYVCLIALGLTLIIMMCLRFFAAIIIYATMIIMIVVSIAATGYTWYQYTRAKKLANDPLHQGNQQIVMRANARNWLTGAIISTIFTLLFLLMMFVMRKRIKLVVKLFQEAGKVLTKIPLLMLQPFWTFLWITLIGSLWMYGLMWMQSSGDVKVYDTEHVSIEQDKAIQVMKWYYAFGLLWLVWFCIGCQHMVIAGAVSKWFFTRDKSQIGYPILTATKWVICYHLGSIAFGSLIIAIIKYIRLILRFIEKNAKDSRNPNMQCIFCLIQCCLKCLEDCIKFITRNAYIEIAIFGWSFCRAAKKAFSIITNNSLRISAINSVGDFALLLAKATVVVIVAFSAMALIRDKPLVVNVWVPVILACLFAYLIADCFITVYEMTIDTLFICFCEDCEMNDGINRPYFMSTSLMQLVEDTSKALDLVSPPRQPKPES